METDLVALLFDSITASLNSFIANDISVMLLGILSIIFTLFAFFKVKEILNMSAEAKSAKSTFERHKPNKDDWRAPLLKEDRESQGDHDEYTNRFKKDYP
ncbi:MAG: hypothetical protein V6Z89_15245 [Desulfobacter sp.]